MVLSIVSISTAASIHTVFVCVEIHRSATFASVRYFVRWAILQNRQRLRSIATMKTARIHAMDRFDLHWRNAIVTGFTSSDFASPWICIIRKGRPRELLWTSLEDRTNELKAGSHNDRGGRGRLSALLYDRIRNECTISTNCFYYINFSNFQTQHQCKRAKIHQCKSLRSSRCSNSSTVLWWTMCDVNRYSHKHFDDPCNRCPLKSTLLQESNNVIKLGEKS